MKKARDEAQKKVERKRKNQGVKAYCSQNYLMFLRLTYIT